MITLPKMPRKSAKMSDRELMGAIVALAATGGSHDTLARLQAEAKRRFLAQKEGQP